MNRSCSRDKCLCHLLGAKESLTLYSIHVMLHISYLKTNSQEKMLFGCFYSFSFVFIYLF